MIEKIKQYKELIAIIVFFLGGFVWLEAEFPKKSDLKAEIESLNCLVEKYMMLTQYQLRAQTLENQVQDFDKKIRAMYLTDSKGEKLVLSPAMEHDLDGLKTELSQKKNDLKGTMDAMDDICNELQRNVCRKAKP